jgi:hypothetical protein
VGSPLLIHGLEDFFMWRKLLQPYKASALPSMSLQLMSLVVLEKSITGSFLIG